MSNVPRFVPLIFCFRHQFSEDILELIFPRILIRLYQSEWAYHMRKGVPNLRLSYGSFSLEFFRLVGDSSHELKKYTLKWAPVTSPDAIKRSNVSSEIFSFVQLNIRRTCTLHQLSTADQIIALPYPICPTSPLSEDPRSQRSLKYLHIYVDTSSMRRILYGESQVPA